LVNGLTVRLPGNPRSLEGRQLLPESRFYRIGNPARNISLKESTTQRALCLRIVQASPPFYEAACELEERPRIAVSLGSIKTFQAGSLRRLNSDLCPVVGRFQTSSFSWEKYSCRYLTRRHCNKVRDCGARTVASLLLPLALFYNGKCFTRVFRCSVLSKA
jgi:hypothetical protein